MHGAGSPATPAKEEKKDIYDGAFTHNIDINDLRNRYLITKGSTQHEVCLARVSPTLSYVWIMPTNEPSRA
jgi:hypothetical protein